MEVAASFRRKVEHVPDRVEQIVVAVLLPGLGRYVEQLGTPEVKDRITATAEHIQDRHVPFLAILEVLLLPYGWDEACRVTEVVAVVGVSSRGQELQPAPTTLLGEGKNARQRRLGDDSEVDSLADVPRGTV